MGASKNAGHVTSNPGGSPIFKPTVIQTDRSLAQPLPEAREVEPIKEEAKATAEEVKERKGTAIKDNTVVPDDGDVKAHVSKVEKKKSEEEENKGETEDEEGEEQEEG